MATNQPTISNKEAARRSQSPISHGRGGAGNISNKPSAPVSANDLQTPNIKSTVYTTGRGGSGNMASNSSAEESRKAQDVEAPVHHQKEQKGTYHWGRGGEGNMMTLGKDNGERRPSGNKQRTGSFKDTIDKGKEMLGLKKEKERRGSQSESAISD